MCFSPIVFIFTITLLGFWGGVYPGDGSKPAPGPFPIYQHPEHSPGHSGLLGATRGGWQKPPAKPIPRSPALAPPTRCHQHREGSGHLQSFAGLLSISIAQSWAHPCTSKPQHLQPVPQSHRIHEISGVLGLFWCFTTLKHPSPPGPGREVQHKQPLASSPEKQLPSLQLGSVPVSSPHSVTVRQHGPKPPKSQQRWDVDPSHPPELSIPRR